MIGRVRGYVGIGSNLGDRMRRLADAVAALDRCGLAVRRVSSVWETEPVDTRSPEWFLNAVVEIETAREPSEVLDVLLGIEREAGRVRGARNAPRVLDLDLLWLGGRTLASPGLTLPHPRMWDRRFVLEPLVELAPDLVDPATGETAARRLDALPGGAVVRRIGTLDRAKADPVYSRTL